MSKLIPGNHKYLTLNERLYIEHSFNEGSSLKDIARFLCKDPTTISKEIKLHRVQNTWNKDSFNNPYNFCIHRFRCKKTNACEKIILCDTLCRSCLKCNTVCSRFERESCSRLDKAPFSRAGVNKSRSEMHHIDAVVTPLIRQGQSPYMILTNHPELGMSVKTLQLHRSGLSSYPQCRLKTQG